MEDTHAWVMNADGTQRREIGSVIDQRQHGLTWSPAGDALYFTYSERGSTRLTRVPLAGGKPEVLVSDLGTVGSFSVSKNGEFAYAFATPKDMPEVYMKTDTGTAQAVTSLNAGVLSGKRIAEVEPFTFTSNDNKFEVEAFLVKPLSMTPSGKYPLVVELATRTATKARMCSIASAPPSADISGSTAIVWASRALVMAAS
ncbi:MAG TPA: hypothetical protein VHZ07_26540 [Bryobacteraceae bacterium]|jgi:dipeptidyl aminopeptidase/acylaminoacyl peptidase|nr:hypothetical protein [Bryobacteraceae bacterium]